LQTVHGLIATALALGAVGLASAAASTPPVPSHAQRAIKQRAGLVAYAPARVPLGFRYSEWTYSPPTLRIFFHQQGKPAGWDITFAASPQAGRCAAHPEGTFNLSGGKVYWTHTLQEQQAWRCVAGPNHTLIRLAAASAIPAKTLPPRTLAQVAAAGHAIG
jgi:hypothetical protein